jgi:hypothetical protein
LEKQVADLKKEAAAPTAPKPASTVPAEPPAKKNLWSNLDIQMYGYIKGDASYDTSRTNLGNFVLWVDSEATRSNDNEFNLTANQTRLGFNIAGPASDTMKTSGKVEFDLFARFDASENTPKLQTRHAYMTLLWPQADLSLIVGQTWDVISPLNPNTLNYSVLWNAGNTGYRRPQIRLTKGLPLNEKVSLKFEGAIVRTIGRTDPTGSETGEDEGFPTVQGRMSVAFPFIGPKPTAIGLSGHKGREEYDLDNTGRNEDLDSQGLFLDVSMPVTKWLTLQGELFSGENLNTYFGGIGQGVNTAIPTAPREIGSKGGWLAASLGPWSKWAFNVGAGVDDVDADDVAVGARTLNSCVFANAIYSWNKHVQAGLELSRWNTDYRGPGDADDTRIQMSFIYNF